MTLTYLYPGSGTTPATASQAAAASIQVAAVQFADADTTATIVHNWAFDTAALARLEPFVIEEQITGGTPSPLLIETKATSQVVITKQSTAAGSGGTVQFSLHRPHSILMPNQ